MDKNKFIDELNKIIPIECDLCGDIIKEAEDSDECRDCGCHTEGYRQGILKSIEIYRRLNLKERSDAIELLDAYSIWLTKNGYMDTDWKDEEPYAIDEFLKNYKK